MMFSFLKPRPIDPRREFLEAFLFYWFSENGFRCARVERNGIDFLAKHGETGALLGIAVRSEAASEQRVFIPREELEDARRACAGFDAAPWFAFASADAGETRFFVVAADRLAGALASGSDGISWGLGPAAVEGYLGDPAIMSVSLSCRTSRWWQT